MSFKLFMFPGSAVKISLTCNDSHTEEWSSSEFIKTGMWTVPIINLAIICYSFVCSLHWEQLQVKIIFLSHKCLISLAAGILL